MVGLIFEQYFAEYLLAFGRPEFVEILRAIVCCGKLEFPPRVGVKHAAFTSFAASSMPFGAYLTHFVEAWTVRVYKIAGALHLVSPPWSKAPTIITPLFSTLYTAHHTSQVPVPIQEAGEPTQPRLRIKVESPQFRSVHWYNCVAYEDGRLPILLTRYMTHARARQPFCSNDLDSSSIVQ